MKKLYLLIAFLLLPLFVHAQSVQPGLSRDQLGNISVEGPTAEDSASSDNPLPVGGIAESTVKTEVADGDAVGLDINTFGRQRMAGYNNATGAVDVNIVNPLPIANGCTHLIDATLNSDGETATGTMFIGDADKLAILVWNTETADTDNSQWDGVLELSPDGTALMTATINVINSEDNAVAAAGDWTFDTTEERYFWFPAKAGITAQYLKLTATCDANCDAGDYHAIDVWVCTNE